MVVFTLVAGVVVCYFSPWLTHLNDTLFSSSGDGFKNFYMLAYYVKYDKGWWFTGMLHPYGEHVIFTDNQPLVAFALNLLRHHCCDVSGSLVGIVNALLFLNLFACAFFIYKTLRLLRLPGMYSALCAALITCVSPTMFRMAGHFSLSYSAILAAAIYLLVLSDAAASGKKIRTAALLGMLSFLSGLIHPYWVLITGMLILSFCFVKIFAERKIPFALLLAGLAGPLFFKILLLLTDPVTDRPQDPWGAKHYAAWFSSVFFPQYSFYEPLRKLLHIRQPEWEAIAYVGAAGLLFLALLAVKIFSRRKKKKPGARMLPGSATLRYLFFAGILILLFSMFIPFRFGMEELFYRIPFLNQFRSLGRFAWAFYFIFAIYYSYGFWLLLRKIRSARGATAFVCAAAVLFFAWFTDLHFTLKSVTAGIRQFGGANALVENRKIAELLAESGYAPGDFQAVLPYPIPAEGSEKLWFAGDWVTRQSVLPYSYQTHTPVLGCIMSRTSVSRTLRLISLTGSDYSEKKIVADLPSALPVLVVASAQPDTSGFLLKRCKEISKNGELTLYILSKDSLEKKAAALQSGFADSVKQRWSAKENYYVDGGAENVIYWTNQNMENTSSGSEENVELIKTKKFELTNTDSAGAYSLSCWVRVTPFGNKVPVFAITDYDSAGKKIREEDVRVDAVNHVDVWGDWVRFEYVFPRQPGSKKLEVEIKGKKSIVDHFLLKPQDVTVAVFPEKLPGKILYNNFLAERKAAP